jgi:hypothetical protein
MPKDLPDIAYVRECLDYDPAAGIFIWRERPPHHFPSLMACRWWNTRFAGKAAGGGSKTDYWRVRIGHVHFKAHRLAWLIIHGEPLPKIIDHIDGDTLNNRISNLRAATHGENRTNQRTLPLGTASGEIGIYFRQRGNSKRFAVHIAAGGRRHWIGHFGTLDEAIAARKEAAKRLHGEFSPYD